MNSFSITNYPSILRQLSPREKANNPSEMLEKISTSKLFEFKGSNDVKEFPLKIQRTLQKIASLKIGQDLLTFLISRVKNPVSLELSDKFSFSRDNNKIGVNVAPFSIFKNHYENCYGYNLFKISFVHELLHLKHSLENEQKFQQMTLSKASSLPKDSSLTIDKTSLLHTDLEDPEEQLTIVGYDYQTQEFALCENHFRMAWGLPIRFTHYGKANPKDVIQNDIPITSNLFKTLFVKYWKKLPPDCFRKECLIVDIAKPTPNQEELIAKISSYVTVHNLAETASGEKERLKLLEFWDVLGLKSPDS